ncbi:MAG: hypothetical protein HY726_20230 [Candidatus Rokubacteria bacterium]|nr:hypothetical protein [Candidatus Rokubacteria bacterium]
MLRGRSLAAVVLAGFFAGCALLVVGWEFPSPTPDMIQPGKTTKADLVRFFGEPYQVGLDTGDLTWSWLYGKKLAQGELTKELTVRLDAKGVVKSYSFRSNHPEDMARLR